MYSVHLAVAAVLLVLSSLPGSHQQCNIDPSLQYQLVESLLTAEFIVYGQYNGVEASTGYGKFTVYCMIKVNGVDMPQNITVRLNTGNCSPTSMDNERRYIVLLRTDSVDNKDHFLLDEPSKDSSAAFPATPANLSAAVNLCILSEEDIKAPGDATQTQYSCPLRTANKEKCVSEDVASVAATRGQDGAGLAAVTTLLLAGWLWA